MFIPKKVKYRKWQKLRGGGVRVASQKLDVAYGSYGLKATTGAWITSRQVEAARRAISRHLKKGGKMWIRIFPDHPITSKGPEVPMGGGKGAVEGYIANVRSGTVMFELGGVTEEIAKTAFRVAGHKLPVRTRFISR